jgi:hypothetical protein
MKRGSPSARFSPSTAGSPHIRLKAGCAISRRKRSPHEGYPLIEMLNEHDVQNVYANFEVSDSLMAKLAG